MTVGEFLSKLINFERKKRKDKTPSEIFKELNIKNKNTFLLKRRFLLVFIFVLAFFLTYFLAEVIYSGIQIYSSTNQREIVWFHEDVDPEGHFIFDPVAGYRLSEKPSRIGAVLPNGELETIGVIRGNDMGFLDDRNFKAPKKEKEVRVAVLGDSFTYSGWTEESWLKVAERRINDQLENKKVFFMNFAIDGGGLANWESIVRNIFLEENLQLDAIIFASWSDDLTRKFHLRHDGYMYKHKDGVDKKKKHPGIKMKYVDSWNPEDYPNKIEDITWGPVESWNIFPSDKVDKIEQGEWKRDTKIKPYLLNELIEALKSQKLVEEDKKVAHAEAEFQKENFKDGQVKLMNNIAHDLEELNLPTLVFSFRGEMKAYEMDELFSKVIQSDYITDLDSNFNQYDYREDIIIKNDGHWNQKGANLFAETVHQNLLEWLKKEGLVNNQ